jgi:hypothetical protein
MSLPIATSTYTLLSMSDPDQDSGDPITYVEVATGVPGVSMFYSGTESVALGHRERVDVRIAIETSLSPEFFDKITDELTGDTWDIAWARQRIGLGLDHWLLGCLEITGTARGQRDL